MKKELTKTGLTVEVRKLRPRDGDLLVFETESPLHAADMDMVSKILRSLPVKVYAVFLSKGERLDIVLPKMTDEQLKDIGLQRIPK